MIFNLLNTKCQAFNVSLFSMSFKKKKKENNIHMKPQSQSNSLMHVSWCTDQVFQTQLLVKQHYTTDITLHKILFGCQMADREQQQETGLCLTQHKQCVCHSLTAQHYWSVILHPPNCTLYANVFTRLHTWRTSSQTFQNNVYLFQQTHPPSFLCPVSDIQSVFLMHTHVNRLSVRHIFIVCNQYRHKKNVKQLSLVIYIHVSLVLTLTQSVLLH